MYKMKIIILIKLLLLNFNIFANVIEQNPLYYQLKKTPTFKQDIRPLITKHCASCHGENSQHGNWLDYEEAYEFNTEIKNRVWIINNMPPVQIENNNIRKIFADWSDAGAPEI
jgi:hypothetical protein